MKKIVLLFVVAVMLFSVSAANAEVLGRKVFAMSGEFIEFIPFSFTVPSGNCNNVRTLEYIPSYPFGGPAHWQELVPGTQVADYSIGIFKFVVDGNACNPEFVVEGPLFEMDIYGVWGGIEIKLEDLGLMVKNVGYLKNVFKLSTDDSQYSYVMVFPPYGRKYTLNGLMKDANSDNFGIQPSGSDLVGVIIPDDRGYLSRIFMFADGKRGARVREQVENIIMHDDQVVVLIYKENY